MPVAPALVQTWQIGAKAQSATFFSMQWKQVPQTTLRQMTYDGGCTLAYAEYGNTNGYPILVQHGSIASIDDHELFDRLVQLKTRLICIARPGYGGSSPHALSSCGGPFLRASQGL